MTLADRDKWEEKYAVTSLSDISAPDAWLLDCVRELNPGRALDLACGLGQNSIALAELGWQLDAVDISPRGLALASEQANQHGVTVNWICADLDVWEPDEVHYDLLIVFRFLDWSRIPAIVTQALRPGGTLLYETFAASQMRRTDNHLKNPGFTVREGDWEKYFPDLDIVFSQRVVLPNRDVARLRAEKASGGEAAPRGIL